MINDFINEVKGSLNRGAKLPFGEETSLKILFPETILPKDTLTSYADVVYRYITLTEPLVHNKVYKVTINGVTYNAFCRGEDDGEYPYLGPWSLHSKGISDEPNGEPFCVSHSEDFEYEICIIDTGVGDYTVSISLEEETITPIDTKYLPMDEIIAAVKASL